MSSMPPPNYMPTDPLTGSPEEIMGGNSMFFGEEEPLFPSPLDGENLVSYNGTPWQNADEMTGNSTSAQSWQASVEMTRNNSSATTQSHQSNQPFSFAEVSPTTALPSIEMPTQNSSSPSSVASVLSNTSPRGTRTRKRKSSPLTEEEEEDEETPESPQRPPLKKTAHNMIEKRYRTNLNDKIAALRQSVPSLRATEKSLSGKGGRKLADMIEDLDGLVPPNKLNKATILSKATEYIGHLERRNQALNSEKKSLHDRINTFEALLLGRKHQGQQMYHPDQLLLQQHQMMDPGNVNQHPSRN